MNSKRKKINKIIRRENMKMRQMECYKIKIKMLRDCASILIN